MRRAQAPPPNRILAIPYSYTTDGLEPKLELLPFKSYISHKVFASKFQLSVLACVPQFTFLKMAFMEKHLTIVFAWLSRCYKILH
jgi:hypothetical protein